MKRRHRTPITGDRAPLSLLHPAISLDSTSQTLRPNFAGHPLQRLFYKIRKYIYVDGQKDYML